MMHATTSRSPLPSLLGMAMACIIGGILMIGAIWTGPASVGGPAMIAALLVCGALWGAIDSNERAEHRRPTITDPETAAAEHGLETADPRLHQQ